MRSVWRDRQAPIARYNGPVMPTDEQFYALERKVEELTNKVARLQDVQAVRDLQFKYGYYLDKCLYD